MPRSAKRSPRKPKTPPPVLDGVPCTQEEARSLRLLRSMSEHLEHGKDISDKERGVMESALGNQRFALKVFVSALASHKVARLTRLLGHLDKVEGELYTDRHLKFCETGDLIRLFEATSKDVNTDLSFLRDVAEQEDAVAMLSKLFETEQVATGDGAFNKLPSQSRAKLLALFAGVRSRLKKKASSEDG